MAVDCVVRVVQPDRQRQLLSLSGCATARQLRQRIALRLGVAPELVAVVRSGSLLDDDAALASFPSDASANVHVVAFVIDPERRTRAAEAVRIEPSLETTPLQRASGLALEESNGYVEIPFHEAIALLHGSVTAAAREPLVAMGFPESRVVKALLLNNRDTQAAMEWLLDHEDDPDIDTPLTPPQITQLVGILFNSPRAGGRRPDRLAMAIAHAVRARICTYSITRDRFVPQQFRCSVCHEGHDLSEVVTSDAFYCDCGSNSAHRCRCLPPRSGSASPRAESREQNIFSARQPFIVVDASMLQDVISTIRLARPFLDRLSPDQMDVLVDLATRISAPDSSAEISDVEFAVLTLLLDVMVIAPAHVIGLFASVIRHRSGTERILSSPLASSLIPRITSICIETQSEAVTQIGLAFAINLTACAIKHNFAQSFALSSFSHMMGICKPLICEGDGLDSFFAIELMGNYALMAPRMGDADKRTLLRELLNACFMRTTQDALMIKLLVAFGTMLELCPGIYRSLRPPPSDDLFSVLLSRWHNLIPIIIRLRQLVG
ncbi:unnamed protein product (mitochondrion) [Plasmodiophora brassicae]|uniref:UBA domain-containing protein n=1 Tax=Plasmodiophora brassicae TaxID=37360 RepID=A0A3P3YHB5_PLABS|nr:unnamed protein product [Plasmodiophora brassicae]